MTYEGRFGWHPCDRETFLKLKMANKAAMKALSQIASWKRWIRKAPHNRVIRPKIRDSGGVVIGYGNPIPMPEPTVNPLFCERVKRKVYFDHLTGAHYPGGKMAEFVEPRACLRETIDDYYNARHPVPKDQVRPLTLSPEKIAALSQ